MKTERGLRVVGILLALTAGTPLMSQAPAPAANQPAAPGRRGGGLGGGFNRRPPVDAAKVERGKGLYSVNCTFCHGIDARGGEGGPNLLRSQLVLDDNEGEAIGPVIQSGRPDRGMPKFQMDSNQVADIAAFIHSLSSGSRGANLKAPASIITGDAKSGEAYFRSKCASCHSVTGDLKGIAARIPDPKSLQQNWLMPGGGGFGAPPSSRQMTPKTVTVTAASGEKIEGELVRIDDFTVTLAAADGISRTFTREGDTPKVVVHDPMLPHKQLLPTYTDKDIHDLTAYLVTLK
jgi:cytochrome c oxidase cbb3-type subunit III